MKKMKRFAAGDMIEGDASVSEQMEQMPAKAAPTPPKNRVVTKEELAASGLSLRDFLNKERGLTRRGEAAPAKTEAPAKPPVAKKELKPMEAQESSAPPGYYRSFSGKMMPKTATERPDLGAMIGSGVSKVGKALGSLYEKPEKYMTKEEKESKMRAGSSSYKTGGSVSKASKRADGIAQKGKTRGKMC
jgi:hypothetical protein